MSSESSYVFSGVFMAEEIDGTREKRSGDTTTIGVQTLLEAFLNMFCGLSVSLMRLFW
jgi:hypothetical protein